MEVLVGVMNVIFIMSGGIGDVDFYVCVGSVLIILVYDCCLYEGGNNEVCFIDNLIVGIYYVMFNGYFVYLGVSLVGDLIILGIGIGVL